MLIEKDPAPGAGGGASKHIFIQVGTGITELFYEKLGVRERQPPAGNEVLEY
jgi:hypothetical protein